MYCTASGLSHGSFCRHYRTLSCLIAGTYKRSATTFLGCYPNRRPLIFVCGINQAQNFLMSCPPRRNILVCRAVPRGLPLLVLLLTTTCRFPDRIMKKEMHNNIIFAEEVETRNGSRISSCTSITIGHGDLSL